MTTTDFDHARALAEQAVTAMVQLGVAPNPRNFKLWFQYAQGLSPDLGKAIDSLATGEGPVPQVAVDELYARFVKRDDNARELEDIGQKIGDQIESLVQSLATAGRQNEAYGAALGLAYGQLSRSPDGAGFRNVVEGLIQATRAMEAKSRSLEEKLTSSTQEVSELRQRLEITRKEALTDQLTGLANRKHFDERLNRAAAEAASSGQPLALLMCDIDFFKKFNDTYGHQTGDQVLRLVSECLRDSVKGRDLAARYGGEEFAVILPRTALSDSAKLAEQIRALVESKKLVKKSTGENLGVITLSIGAAVLHPNETPADLIMRADACLYAAKRAGRNRVLSETEVDVTTVLADSGAARARKTAA